MIIRLDVGAAVFIGILLAGSARWFKWFFDLQVRTEEELAWEMIDGGYEVEQVRNEAKKNDPAEILLIETIMQSQRKVRQQDWLWS